MNVKAHLETAWHGTLQYIVPLVIMTLVMAVVSGLTLGILAPVTMAGYMQAIIEMVRDRREPKVQDLFAHMNLFLPLLGFFIVVFILTLIGFMLMVLPGFLIALAIAYFCLYMLPLMTDKKMGLTDAVKESSRMVKQNVQDHIVALVLYIGISWVGSLVVVGFLFTQPLATVFLIAVYLEKTGQRISRG